MGMDLILEAEPEVEFDQGWTKTDGKEFIDVLWQSLNLIENHLKIELSPLKKLGSDELTLEDAAEIAEDTGVSAEQMVKDTEAANKAAWQPPGDLARCLRTLIPLLGDHGKDLPLAKLKKNHRRSYFAKDYFLSDLKDLLRWAEKANKGGAKQVKITIY
jgi:hypothetical protein